MLVSEDVFLPGFVPEYRLSLRHSSRPTILPQSKLHGHIVSPLFFLVSSPQKGVTLIANIDPHPSSDNPKVSDTHPSSSARYPSTMEQSADVSSLTALVPANSWDAHMHVTDLSRFPPPSLSGSTPGYHAKTSTLAQARAHAHHIGLHNLVFVQPSTFGTDNACVLWCLSQSAPGHARGVVVIDPDTVSSQMLLDWHAQGVRGVRLNLKSVGASPSAEELRALVLRVDKVLAVVPSWGIHFYVHLREVVRLRDATRGLERRVCIDHMGALTEEMLGDREGAKIADLEGWKTLLQMLQNPNFFTKVSAPYRIVEDVERWVDMEGIVRELMACRDGDAVVFASDWPHTRFEAGTDVAPWRDLCLQWCAGNGRLREKLFKSNAEYLYDAPEERRAAL